jgi:beta-1,3-galactosyltransferase 1
LTIKTLRVLKWFLLNLPKSKFLAKTDDDVFVNGIYIISNYIYTVGLIYLLFPINTVPRLIKHLQRVEAKLKFESESFNYLGGVVSDARGPHTLNTFSKWYVPPKLWKEQSAALSKLTKDRLDHIPLANYPPYLVGNFYVIGGNTVPLLLNTSMQLPLFHLEDVFLTGFVGSELLNINLETIPNIFTTSSSFPLLSYYYAKWFTYPRDMIAYHCDNEVEIIKQVYEDSLKE